MKSSERVKIVRKTLNISQQKFADALEISRSYVNLIESGRAEPSFSFVTCLRNTYNVSADWIITGEGEMFIPAPKKASIFDDEPHQVIAKKLETAIQKLVEATELVVEAKDAEQKRGK